MPNLYTQLLQLPLRVDDIEYHLRADQGGIQVDDDAQAERHGKSLDRPGAEHEEHSCRNERRHVRVEDREERLVISGANRGTRLFARTDLLADALEHKHVRVDTHADGQNAARTARQGERGIEKCN